MAEMLLSALSISPAQHQWHGCKLPLGKCLIINEIDSALASRWKFEFNEDYGWVSRTGTKSVPVPAINGL